MVVGTGMVVVVGVVVVVGTVVVVVMATAKDEVVSGVYSVLCPRTGTMYLSRVIITKMTKMRMATILATYNARFNLPSDFIGSICILLLLSF